MENTEELEKPEQVSGRAGSGASRSRKAGRRDDSERSERLKGLLHPSNVGAINGVGGGTGFGNYGFGNILGPGQANWDMSLAKLIKIHEAQSLQFRAEFYNTLNHPLFSNLPGSDVQNGSAMGQITTTSVSPRVIQFALKFLF